MKELQPKQAGGWQPARGELILRLQFEARRQLFNTNSQAVIFSLRATIPFASQMPNYSLHLISMPRGDACQGRAASFKISHIRLVVIQPGRRVQREEKRPHELWGDSFRNVEDLGSSRAKSAPSAASHGSTWMLALAGDIPCFMGSGKGFMVWQAHCGPGTDRYRAPSVLPAISHELFDQGKFIRFFSENSIFFSAQHTYESRV